MGDRELISTELDEKECSNAIYSDEYADYILPISGDVESIRQRLKPDCVQIISRQFVIIHENIETKGPISMEMHGYGSVPKCFGLLDTASAEEMGVYQVRRQPYLQLYGSGISLAIIDSGIDYTNPLFINADGTTRIRAIWDQTKQGGKAPEGFAYGEEYLEDQINEALKSDNPQEIVPVNDPVGHGTFMAGVAAGNEDEAADFTGIAPLANLVVVKLKPAKESLKDFYGIPQTAVCYQENDIMLAVQYVLRKAAQFYSPMILCFGIGTNAGNHDGKLPLCIQLEDLAERQGIGIVVGGGDETNLGHHYYGDIGNKQQEEVELNVAEGEGNFSLELWTQIPDVITVGIISPLGEFSDKIPLRVDQLQKVDFLLEDTVIFVNYDFIEYYSGEEVIFMRFRNPTPGIWRIRVYNEDEFSGGYNMWLPREGFIKEGTKFLRPSPDITICEPANTHSVITPSNYNSKTGGIYIHSSRGLTSSGFQKPDIAAPGVNIYGPVGNNRFGTRTGSSISAANTAGICTLLLEWGFEKGNRLDMGTISMKNYLIKGATRSNLLEYPNREWGYGKVNIYQTLESLQRTV